MGATPHDEFMNRPDHTYSFEYRLTPVSSQTEPAIVLSRKNFSKVNIAAGKPVSSDSEKSGNPAKHANDGVSNSTDQIIEDTFNTEARYVRITMTDLESGIWASFYEVESIWDLNTHTRHSGGRNR